MKRWILLALIGIALPGFAIKVPNCNVICEKGQACGNRCISKSEACDIPLGWGRACDASYISVMAANKAQCCKNKGGVAGCAGDRLVCSNGTLSDKCGCHFIVESGDKINPW